MNSQYRADEPMQHRVLLPLLGLEVRIHGEAAERKMAERQLSSHGPPLQITAGTTITSRAVVEQRAPITYLLPILRETSGLLN